MIGNMKIIPSKFFRNIEGSEGLYEIRTEYGGNIYRVFCCMKTDAIVVFFQGFQKKTKKTPFKELKMAE
ncbi:putative toxin-antitoxin system, toxin component, RelE family [Segatella oris F0302]|uniref:Putative toxin-antitoxin system, toxin component, RelE family n=2 Tax=Segatella oris TaxID=28135 RepID=D1QVF9_9BACT|nr:putative toxin-antitoxin system, toxin component, RelE family [Segatella oris F0302]MBF1449254.1 type II toxin-antitoxin system RelE/ParE family toxin [Segatella oris]